MGDTELKKIKGDVNMVDQAVVILRKLKADTQEWETTFEEKIKKLDDETKKERILKDFHRCIQTVAWAIEPYQHKEGKGDNVRPIDDDRIQRVFRALQAKANKWEIMTTSAVVAQVEEVFGGDELKTYAEKRELLRRMYDSPGIPDEYEIQRKHLGERNYARFRTLVIKNKKKVFGVLAKWNFILNSGNDTSKGKIEKRQLWAEEMKEIVR